MALLNKNPAQAHIFEVALKFGGQECKCSFSRVGGVSEETASTEWRYGDEPPVLYHLAGLTTYGDLVLEDGLDPDDAIRQWRELVVAARGAENWPNNRVADPIGPQFGVAAEASVNKQGSGDLPTEYWGMIVVKVKGRDNQKLVREFVYRRAWPTTFEYGEFNSMSNDVTIRTATFKIGHAVEKNPDAEASLGRRS